MEDKPVKCEQHDMDCWAKREVKTEVYAIQNYRDFGCAGCATAVSPLAPSSMVMVALLMGAAMLGWTRRRR